MEKLEKQTVEVTTGTNWNPGETVRAEWDESIELIDGVSFIPGKEINIEYEVNRPGASEIYRYSDKELMENYKKIVDSEATAARAVIGAVIQWETFARRTAACKYEIEKRLKENQE